MYMREALREAEKAALAGDVPVGALVVCRGEILGRGRNNRVAKGNPLGHAELEALKDAAHACGSWRFDNAALYVTLEPCIMCCGALVQCRMKALYYGAADPRGGAAGSLYDIPGDPRIPVSCDVQRGILEAECRHILQNFFRQKRRKTS